MAWSSSTRACAKINLTLHIRGRFENGYHDLESLVAFADVGDDLTLVAGDHLSLSISGPEARELSVSTDNHILKATEAFRAMKPDLRVGRFHLVKRLPIASGIGGGSADAAAALRLLAKLNNVRLDDPRVFEAALVTGADVPVCLQSRPRMMRGIGNDLSSFITLPSFFAVLINPRVATPTPAVFSAIDLQIGEQRKIAAHEHVPDFSSTTDAVTFLSRHRNDMEPAATRLVPQIADVTAAVKSTDALFVRMSGSGATVFALYPDCRAAARAAKSLRSAHGEWWVRQTRIGSVDRTA